MTSVKLQLEFLGPYFKSSYMGQECLGKLSLEMNFCSSLALHGDPIWSSPVTRTILLKVTGSKSRRTIPKITLATQGTGNKILGESRGHKGFSASSTGFHSAGFSLYIDIYIYICAYVKLRICVTLANMYSLTRHSCDIYLICVCVCM